MTNDKVEATFHGDEQDREPTWLDESRDKRGPMLRPMPSREWDNMEVDPLTRDVAFNRHSMNDGHHVSPSDNGQVSVGTDDIRVALAQGLDVEQFKKTLTMATRATIGLDLSQPLPGEEGNPIPDWEEMLAGGLQTALETQTLVFAVSGVSRTATHQLVRSRKAAFHQQSQRASYMGDYPQCRMPESVWVNPRARRAFLRATMAAWTAYREICDEDISYQDARFVLPEGSTNFILLEYPVREFLNVYAYRACSMFQWEIVDVMRKCGSVLIEEYPWLEPYIKISCEKTGPVMSDNLQTGYQVQIAEHHCTFQGWESPEGQCPFTWAKDEARTFKPKFHQIGRRTGK